MKRGRPRQFDKSEALEQAMLVFWKNGYRGTSLDDLTVALGINKPSLYAAFGDKETLFLESVDHYRDTFMVPAVRKLIDCDDLEEGLSAFFKAFANIVLENETPPGCLIACLLSEECCESEVIKTKLSEMIAAADKTFCKVFEKHSKQLRSGLSPEQAAGLLTSTVHGLSIRARSGCSKSELMSVCKTFIKIAVA